MYGLLLAARKKRTYLGNKNGEEGEVVVCEMEHRVEGMVGMVIHKKPSCLSSLNHRTSAVLLMP